MAHARARRPFQSERQPLLSTMQDGRDGLYTNSSPSAMDTASGATAPTPRANLPQRGYHPRTPFPGSP